MLLYPRSESQNGANVGSPKLSIFAAGPLNPAV